MKKLLQGIIEFRQQHLHAYREKFAHLADGQAPDTLFIACCDSRVVPNTFVSTNPGDLFVLRNIGNLVPPYHPQAKIDGDAISVKAAVEFALQILNVSDIIICGHAECGAMLTVLNDFPPNDLPGVKRWLTAALPAKMRLSQAAHCCSQQDLSLANQLSQVNVLQQLEHLQAYPLVAERLQQNQLRLHGWWFDLAHADVYVFDKNVGKFILLDEPHAQQLLRIL